MMLRSAWVSAGPYLVVSLFSIFSVASAPGILSSSSSQTPAEPDGVPAILVSRQLRESERLTIGEVVSLSSDPAGTQPRRFRIVGEYEPVPDPMRLGAINHEVRLHLPDLTELTSDGADPLAQESVDAINVRLGRPGDAPEAAVRASQDFVRDLSTRIPGLVVRPTTGDEGRAAPFIVLERFHLAIAIVTVVASSIFLLALMLMLVDERRETVGILRLIGFRRRRILFHVLAEGVVIAVAGALFGILLCVAFQNGINRFFQWRYDTALVFVRITPLIALRSVTLSVPLGVLAVVASSWTLLSREVFALTRR